MMGEALPTQAEKPTFYRQGIHGYIELVDAVTGAVISIQETMEPLPLAQFIEIEIDNRKVMVQSGVDRARLLGLRVHVPYSKALADIVCQKMIDGVPWSKLYREKGIPDTYTLSLWRRQHPDFDTAVRFARRARAEGLRDKALELGEGAERLPTDMVGGTKLAIETLKWAAEKDDPEAYGQQSKVKVDGTIGVVQLVVETGIRRRGDAGIIKDVDQSTNTGHSDEAVEVSMPDLLPKDDAS